VHFHAVFNQVSTPSLGTVSLEQHVFYDLDTYVSK
jgi:hypothetical protein